jgi:hypothetical protein
MSPRYACPCLEAYVRAVKSFRSCETVWFFSEASKLLFCNAVYDKNLQMKIVPLLWFYTWNRKRYERLSTFSVADKSLWQQLRINGVRV